MKLVIFPFTLILMYHFIDINGMVFSLTFDVSIVLAALVFSYIVSSFLDSVYFSSHSHKISSGGKCVLITGCDSGFGHQTAIQLCNDGFTVFAGCLDAKSVESNSLKGKTMNPSKMHLLQFNVIKEEDLKCVHDTITTHMRETGDKLYSVINNAGLSTFGPFDWGDMEDVKNVFDVNTWAVIDITRYFIPLLVKCPHSRMIYVSTVTECGALPAMSTYMTSKVATEAFLQSLTREISADEQRYNDMKVITIAPTAHRTNMLNLEHMMATINSKWNKTDQSTRDVYGPYIHYGVIFFFKIWQIFEFSTPLFLTSDLTRVSRCISSCLLRDSPKQRYHVMNIISAKSLHLLPFIPTEIFDFPFQCLIVILHYGSAVLHHMSELIKDSQLSTEKKRQNVLNNNKNNEVNKFTQ